MKNVENTLLFKFMKYFSALVIIALFGALCQVAWWVWYPYDVLEFERYCYKDNVITTYCSNKHDSEVFEGIVLNKDKKVKRGEFLEIKISFFKKYDLPTYKINRQLSNDRYVTLTCEEGGVLPAGKHEKEISIFIPTNIWPGRYRLTNIYTYRLNPIREVHENWSTEWFEILP